MWTKTSFFLPLSLGLHFNTVTHCLCVWTRHAASFYYFTISIKSTIFGMKINGLLLLDRCDSVKIRSFFRLFPFFIPLVCARVHLRFFSHHWLFSFNQFIGCMYDMHMWAVSSKWQRVLWDWYFGFGIVNHIHVQSHFSICLSTGRKYVRVRMNEWVCAIVGW